MTVEERLERLERENRILKAGGAALLLVVLAAGVMGASKGEAIPDVVKARAFHVIGKDGTILAKLADGYYEPDAGSAGSLSILGRNGKTLVVVGAAPWGGGIVHTFHENGSALAWMGPRMDGGGIVQVFNPMRDKLRTHEPVAWLGSINGNGMVRTFSDKGQSLVWIGRTEGDAGSAGMVGTFNGEGQEVARMGIATDGLGLFRAFDPSRRYRDGVLTPRP